LAAKTASNKANGLSSFSQHKVLEDKLAFTSRKRAAASSARNLAFNHFGTNFYSDKKIERIAVWTK
jgi:hypothetical protein